MLSENLAQQQQNFSDYYWRNYVTVLETAENVARKRIPLDAHTLQTGGEAHYKEDSSSEVEKIL